MTNTTDREYAAQTTRAAVEEARLLRQQVETLMRERDEVRAALERVEALLPVWDADVAWHRERTAMPGATRKRQALQHAVTESDCAKYLRAAIAPPKGDSHVS